MLAMNSDWASMPYSEKLMQILINFNYKGYGEKLITIVLQAIQDTLPSAEVDMLRDFLVDLEKLQTSKLLGVKDALQVVSEGSRLIA